MYFLPAALELCIKNNHFYSDILWVTVYSLTGKKKKKRENQPASLNRRNRECYRKCCMNNSWCCPEPVCLSVCLSEENRASNPANEATFVSDWRYECSACYDFLCLCTSSSLTCVVPAVATRGPRSTMTEMKTDWTVNMKEINHFMCVPESLKPMRWPHSLS